MTEPRHRVCHLSSGHEWYDERIFQKEAKSLVKAGYDVSYVVRHDKPEIIDGIRILPLPSPKSRRQRFLVTVWQVLRLAIRENAQVYHFHDPELIPIGILLKLMGKKVVYDVHEDYPQIVLGADWLWRPLRRPIAWIWDNVELLASRVFDHIIVVDSSIQRRFPKTKTEMITNVPPLGSFEEIPRPPADGKFRIVYTGSIIRARGVLKLIEALTLAKAKNVEFHILGWDPDEELECLMASHPQVVYHGRLPWFQTRAFLAQCDLGVLLYQPTPAHLLFTGEGNNKLFEFMSAGIPVLFSDFPNLRGFVESTGAGYAVDPTKPEKIAAAIDYLCEHRELCREMSENGRRAVREIAITGSAKREETLGCLRNTSGREQAIDRSEVVT